MVRLNRIYTRTGDDGSTGLVGGSRVGKDDPRVGAYGTVDELNAWIGMVRAALLPATSAAERELDSDLGRVQQALFDLGSGLATPFGSRWEGQPVIGDGDAIWLESRIDAMNAELQPLQSIVLPGGGPVASALHVGRTVCRRAERETVALSRIAEVAPADVKYLNRLSDWLFVASRWIAHRTGHAETLWQPGGRP
jgi:cob(I)alamin adenosyltransferase